MYIKISWSFDDPREGDKRRDLSLKRCVAIKTFIESNYLINSHFHSFQAISNWLKIFVHRISIYQYRFDF